MSHQISMFSSFVSEICYLQLSDLQFANLQTNQDAWITKLWKTDSFKVRQGTR